MFKLKTYADPYEKNKQRYYKAKQHGFMSCVVDYKYTLFKTMSDVKPNVQQVLHSLSRHIVNNCLYWFIKKTYNNKPNNPISTGAACNTAPMLIF